MKTMTEANIDGARTELTNAMTKRNIRDVEIIDTLRHVNAVQVGIISNLLPGIMYDLATVMAMLDRTVALVDRGSPHSVELASIRGENKLALDGIRELRQKLEVKNDDEKN